MHLSDWESAFLRAFAPSHAALLELAAAADFLDCPALLDCVARKVAAGLCGRSGAELNEALEAALCLSPPTAAAAAEAAQAGGREEGGAGGGVTCADLFEAMRFEVTGVPLPPPQPPPQQPAAAATAVSVAAVAAPSAAPAAAAAAAPSASEGGQQGQEQAAPAAATAGGDCSVGTAAAAADSTSAADADGLLAGAAVGGVAAAPVAVAAAAPAGAAGAPGPTPAQEAFAAAKAAFPWAFDVPAALFIES